MADKDMGNRNAFQVVRTYLTKLLIYWMMMEFFYSTLGFSPCECDDMHLSCPTIFQKRDHLYEKKLNR